MTEFPGLPRGMSLKVSVEAFVEGESDERGDGITWAVVSIRDNHLEQRDPENWAGYDVSVFNADSPDSPLWSGRIIGWRRATPWPELLAEALNKVKALVLAG